MHTGTCRKGEVRSIGVAVKTTKGPKGDGGPVGPTGAVFFFKQKTAYDMSIGDWSSDVCSSDLHARNRGDRQAHGCGRGRTDSSAHVDQQIGRASCRERVSIDVWISVVAVSIKKKIPGKPIEEAKRQFGIRQVVKLASNENPLGPSPRALKAFFFASRRRHTRCRLVTGVQTCALPIYVGNRPAQIMVPGWRLKPRLEVAEIGRASCRERVSIDVWISVVAASLKKKASPRPACRHEASSPPPRSIRRRAF